LTAVSCASQRVAQHGCGEKCPGSDVVPWHGTKERVNRVSRITLSLDWCKGNFTGTHLFLVKTMVSGFNFPLKQSHLSSRTTKTLGFPAVQPSSIHWGFIRQVPDQFSANPLAIKDGN